MDSLQFLVMFCCFALVASWYVENERKGAKGTLGLLAVADAAREQGGERSTYKMRAGPAVKARVREARRERDAPEGVAAATYRTKERNPRFREKEEAAYRTRGPLPQYGERPKRP